MTWVQHLIRVFANDVEKCEKCDGKVIVISSIEDPEVIEKILKHLGLGGIAGRKPFKRWFDSKQTPVRFEEQDL
ncbi:MAG: hypothetical protein VCB26_10525 [Candidatus Hydrogenedentota bacterium]|jgi:hypothetical protein